MQFRVKKSKYVKESILLIIRIVIIYDKEKSLHSNWTINIEICFGVILLFIISLNVMRYYNLLYTDIV